MSDDELEAILEELKRLCDESMARRAEELLNSLDRGQQIEFGESTVVLLGFEGNVDVAWDVPSPRPDVLLRPLFQRMTRAVSEADPYAPGYSVATYRRVGQFTYERVA